MKKERGGAPTHIGSLFDAYRQRLRPPQESVVRVFVEVVGDVLGLTLKPEQVSFTVANKTLYLRAPAVLKNEIKLHEAELMPHLKARLGEETAPKHIV